MNTRRDFLTTLARSSVAVGVATLSASCSTQRGAASGKSARVLVPAHPWVYAATQPNYDITPILEPIFADMKYAGLDGIELMHTALRPAAAVERIGNLSRKHELPVIGTSYGENLWDRNRHTAILEDAEKVVANLAALGGCTLGMSVGSAGKPKTPEQFDAQADCLRRFIKIAEARGVVLNLHNHTYEVENNLHDLRGTLARIPDAKLGPDLNWLVRGGVDPVGFLDTYGRQIVFLHLRDQLSNGRWSEALGEGAMDYDTIAQALRRIGFKGYATIELAHERDFKPTRPIRESLKLSREFVRRKLGY